MRAVHDEPLQAWGGHDGDLVLQRMAEQQAAEAVAVDADVVGVAVVGDERQGLQAGAAGEHVLQAALLRDAVADAELLEVGEDVGAAREAGGVREAPDAEVEAAERGAAAEEGPR